MVVTIVTILATSVIYDGVVNVTFLKLCHLIVEIKALNDKAN
jgi:hypothetical protein